MRKVTPWAFSTALWPNFLEPSWWADVHELSSEERQPYLIRAKPTALDLENVLAELYRLIGNSKKQSKWNKSGIKNIPIRQPKSSRGRLYKKVIKVNYC